MSLRKPLSRARAALLFAALALAPTPARADAHADAIAEGDRLSKQAERLYASNRYAEALDAARKELAIFERELGADAGKTATALSDVGAMHLAQGDLREAEPFLRRAVETFERAKSRDDGEYAGALNNLAALYAAKNQSTLGQPYLERAIAILEKSPGTSPSTLASYYATLATMLGTRDAARASDLFQKAIAIHEKKGPERALVVNLLRYGNFTRYSRGAAAEPIYHRAYELALKVLGPADKLTGEIRRGLGRLFWGAGTALNATGERIYQEGYDALVASLGPNHPDVAALMQDWAVMKQIEGDLDGSLDLRRRADVIEERQLDRLMEGGTEADRLDYARKLYGRVDYAIQLALTLGEARKSVEARRYAVSMVLSRKGQVLDVTAGRLAALRAHASPEEKELLASLAHVRGDLATATLAGPGQDLAAFRARLAGLEAKEHGLELEVAERSASYRAVKQPVTLEAVQAALPQGAALLEIFRWNAPQIHSMADRLSGGERYVVFIIEKENVPWPFILGEDAQTVDCLVHELRDALASPGDKRVYDVGYRLSTMLLLRVENGFKKYSSIFIAPDSELNLVPFAALLDAKLDFMVRKYTFTYLSSGRNLLHFAEHVPSASGPVLFANPLYDPSPDGAAPRTPGARGLSSEDLARMRFRPLPGTQAEAEAIAEVLPDAKVLTGAAATEGAIKAVHAPVVLHVATHGFFLSAAPIPAARRTRGLDLDPGAPQAPSRVQVDNPLLRSGLAFAGANVRHSGDEDGVLTALEASDLDLHGTKLVVLSACETGLGDVTRGQGVFSLRRALALAGAETQVMSLWEVDDDATRTLMSGYYRKLFVERRGRSEALRDVEFAMLDTKETAHPFYWSAFIVSGDPSPIASPAAHALPAVPRAMPGARGCACGVAGAGSAIEPGALLALLLGLMAGRRRPPALYRS